MVNMVARITHIQRALEINSKGHGYQEHHAGHPRQHLLYVGIDNPAGKMLCPHALLPA
jgi:hypothetical protein